MTLPAFSKILLLSLLLLVSFVSAHAGGDAQVTLVRDGNPAAVIVVNKADRETRTTGLLDERSLWEVVLDFQRVIEKMSGAKLPIVFPEEVPAEGTRIYIGNAVPKSVWHGDDKGLDPRGYWIIATPDTLVLRGKTEGGTINALYGFLQDKLGVRWFFPSELFEVIPQQKTVSVPVGKQMVNPDFKGGMFISSGGSRDAAVWDERMRRDVGAWLYQAPSVHFLGEIINSAKFGKTHPEFFALKNGERQIPPPGDRGAAQPCLSNPQLVEEVIKFTREYFDQYPNALMVSIGINDTVEWCECDACRAMDVGPPEIADGCVQHSDRYFTFANQVARALAKSHPGKMIGCLAYNGTVIPPKNIEKLEPNIVIGLTQDHTQHYDPAYKAHDRANIEAWKKKGVDFMAYTYTGLSWLLPRYDPHQYAEYLREAHRLGAQSVLTEGHVIWSAFGPEMYLAAQLLWDANKDPDTVLDDLFYGLFGKEVGAEIKAYYEVFEKAWMRPNPNRKGKWFEGWSYLHEQMAVYTLDDLDRALAHLEKALKLATDPLIKKRVEYIAHNFSYPATLMRGWLTSDQIDALVNRGDIASAEDAARLRAMLRTVAEMMDKEEPIYKETLLVDPISANLYKTDWKDHFGILRGQWPARCGYSLKLGATALIKYYNAHGQEAQVASLKSDLPETVVREARESATETLGEELIPHGDMETPEALLVWTNDGVKTRLVTMDEGAHAGKHSLRLDPEKNWGNIFFPKIPVNPSTKYNYSFWYKGLERGSLYFSVTPQTGGGNLIGADYRMEEWTRATGSFITPEGCREVSLGFHCVDGTKFLIDDVSICEVIDKNLVAVERVGEDFPDWSHPTITLNALDQVGTVLGKPEEKWRGAEKFSALACLGWQQDGLRLAVKVTDPEHLQPNSGSNIWNGDSIQFGISTVANRAGRSFTKGLDAEHDFLYGLALTQIGKTDLIPELFVWNAPPGKPAGSIAAGTPAHTFSVQRTGNTTLYDVRISWEHLGMSPRDGRRFGFNLVVFDSFKAADGNPNLVWLQLSPGIAGSESLSPVLWKNFVIKK